MNRFEPSDPDERMREAFGSGPRTSVASSGSCPDDSTVWAAARGELPGEQTRKLIDHSLHCARCADSWAAAAAMLGALGETSAGTGDPPARAGARRPSRTITFLGLAAAAALAFVLLPLALREDAPVGPPDEYREPPSSTRIRSEIDESAPMPRDAFVLRWSGMPEGSRYVVEVATEDLTVIHRATELDRPEYVVPAAALIGVPSGATVLWRIEAVVPGGGRVESPVFRGTVG